jgi:hypothetical protein
MRRSAFLAAVLCVATAFPSLEAWSNGGKSTSASVPKFGTHDYIAFKGYELAGKPSFIKNNINAFFIGTEAPDAGEALFPSAVGSYPDTGACHCILFKANGDISKDRLEVRVQEEFDKMKDALDNGHNKLAAFYAGAMAHYLGDLSQFCHIMGPESHWGSENRTIHSNYEKVVDKTIKFQDMSSALLDAFVEDRSVAGTTPGAIAVAVARFTEKGNSGRTPKWMHAKYKAMMAAGESSNPTNWDDGFRDQTGQSVNVSINGIKKALGLLDEE